MSGGNVSAGQVHTAEHTVEIAAPAKSVYGVIADVTCWPYVFGPTVHVDVIEQGNGEERLRIWATANGEVKSWTSRRELNPAAWRIAFRQEVSQPPVASMGGEWRIVPRSAGECAVVLTHDYVAVDDRSENAEWIAKAIDHNSTAELSALRVAAERAGAQADVTLDFDDTLKIHGSAEDVYDFLYHAQQWPERLPHVSRLDLCETTPNLQIMDMDTRTKEGSVHTTNSIRICFPRHTIVYKQTKVPALMTAHTGRWEITQASDCALATSHHTVVLNPDAVTGILGADATLQDARRFVRGALGANSGTTLQCAKAYAESRRNG
jgi:ribosome-associated toxin RatA of RatAB toxin-antitoxin module